MRPLAAMASSCFRRARVAKSVDAGDSKSPAARCAGSSPAPGTRRNSQRHASFLRGIHCADKHRPPRCRRRISARSRRPHAPAAFGHQSLPAGLCRRVLSLRAVSRPGTLVRTLAPELRVLHALAIAELCVSAWQLHAPAVQHAGPVDVRRRAGARLGPQTVHPDPGRQHAERGTRAAALHLGHRCHGPHGGRLGRNLWAAAVLRHAVPEPHHRAADSADPDEGQGVCRDLRRAGADPGFQQQQRRGPLRPPRRHAGRLAADPPLALAAAALTVRGPRSVSGSAA
mmetsp:Transcript_41221/g.96406  ORF Transcript_41221/g.96406 Transcript_41221/m.96406 type:complete len:285 (+) Transcript_41221:2053-2907(+)